MSNEELLQALTAYIGKEIGSLNKRIDDLEKNISARLDALERRMDAIEGRMDALEGRVDALEKRMDAMEMDFNTRLDNLERSLKEYVNREVADVMDYALASHREVVMRLDNIDRQLNIWKIPQMWKKIK